MAFLVLVASIVGISVLVRDHPRQVSSSNKLSVVAAENFWGNIAAQIGGDHVSVTSIITDPNTDPHLYESNANNANSVSRAAVVIKNGLGYDDFMDRLLSSDKNSSRQVLSVNTILQVNGNDPNPHLWYDVAKVPTVADAIEKALATKDPADASSFATNLGIFKSSLGPIDTVISEIKAKYAGTPVAYTERVPGYLLTATELDVKTPAGFASSIEDGNDPSPRDSATMESLMTNHQVRVLLYNSQATSAVTKHIQDLAKQAGISVVGVTETLPAGDTYQSWQLSQEKALLQALGG